MKRFTLITSFCILIVSCIPPANCKKTPETPPQQNPEITIDELSEHIQYLSSDELKGRYPGTAESKLRKTI